MKKVILDELETIRSRHGGVLRAADLVAFARNPKTALHDRFQWDDTEAAEAYRLWQARQIIRVSVTVLPQVNQEFRAYVSLMDDRKVQKGGYRATIDVLKNDDQRQRLLKQALAELRGFRARYEQLRELAPVFAAIEEVAVKVEGQDDLISLATAAN